jgi:folate-binding protein YgfZ
MHHNPHATSEPSGTPDQPPAPAPAFALPGHRVIALSGRDAVAFAQAQCMNDVESAPVGRWQWNGWLTPKGRVIALFALVRVASDTLWLVVPDADAQALAAQLQRFVLRRQLTVAVRDDLHASGRFEAPARAAGAIFDGDADTGIELDLGGFGIPRTLRIAPEAAERDGACEMQWTASDLRVGFPRLPPSQAEQWTPQMLSLERLNAYSVKKGCYPGQEIVARTHFLGQVKRGIAFFEAPSELEAGANVDVGAAPLGQIVSTARNGATWVALAVLPVDRPDAQIASNGIPLRERALLAGLAR